MKSLEGDSSIHRVRVAEFSEKDERYIHEHDVKLLESLKVDFPEPRISLLPPLRQSHLRQREDKQRVFGFDYNHEMFLPKHKRKFGYYVLPILWGEADRQSRPAYGQGEREAPDQFGTRRTRRTKR